MCDSNRGSEVANGTVNIKDVKTQQQYTVPMEELSPRWIVSLATLAEVKLMKKNRKEIAYGENTYKWRTTFK